MLEGKARRREQADACRQGQRNRTCLCPPRHQSGVAKCPDDADMLALREIGQGNDDESKKDRNQHDRAPLRFLVRKQCGDDRQADADEPHHDGCHQARGGDLHRLREPLHGHRHPEPQGRIDLHDAGIEFRAAEHLPGNP